MSPEPLPPGTRVRHYGDQFPRAFTEGTATVVGHFHINGHLEYRVRRDPTWATDAGVREWSAEATIPVNVKGPQP